MTIKEIVRAATAEHMSYGQYVLRYNPPGDKKSHSVPKRVCKKCGVSIDDRPNAARYCLMCAAER